MTSNKVAYMTSQIRRDDVIMVELKRNLIFPNGTVNVKYQFLFEFYREVPIVSIFLFSHYYFRHFGPNVKCTPLKYENRVSGNSSRIRSEKGKFNYYVIIT